MKTLEEAFAAFVEEEKLFIRRHSLLLAISGGLDSVVCAALLKATGFSVEWAHMNFRLRGAESDRDEQFVTQLAAGWNVVLHTAGRDTAAIATQRKSSIQETARQLRYEWFEDLRNSRDLPFDRIVTAHQAIDNAETFLLHALRGTALTGLGGIPVRRGRIVRPLLFATREELRQYAAARQLQWVEDSSNEKTDYDRNRVRHEVLPLLESAFPGSVQQIAATALRVREQKYWYDEAVQRRLRKMVTIETDVEKMPVRLLLKIPNGKTLFFEWLYAKGFSPGQVDSAWKLTGSQTGAYHDAAGYRLLRNRNWLNLQRLPIGDSGTGLIDTETGDLITSRYRLTWKLQPYRGEAIPDSSHIAWLDSRLVEFPLLIRTWKAGDYFYPLGMPSKKKLARFMTDLRMSRSEKEQAFVVETGNRIAWLAGRRIDHRFRITPATRQVLALQWEAINNAT